MRTEALHPAIPGATVAGMSWARAATFHEQLAVTLDAGLSISQAVQLAGSTAGGPLRAQGATWSSGCAGGKALAEQLAADGQPAFDVALVKAGEVSGRLPELCRELAAHYRHRIELRTLVIGRLVYPLVLIHVTLLALGIVLTFWSGWSPWVIIGLPLGLWLTGAAAWMAWGLLQPTARARLALTGPFAPLTLPLVAANTCSVLRAALSAGMLMPDALELSAGACGNQTLGGRLAEAGRDLRHNRLDSLAAALARCGLPPLVVDHITSGERSGSLDRTLGQAAALMRESFRLRAEWTARIACGIIYGAAMLGAVAVIFMFWSGYLSFISDVSKDL
jgi:type II secretory pathway component PulF